jgi:hypothetical protein
MASGPRHAKQNTQLHDLDSKPAQTNVLPLMSLEETTRRRQDPDGLGEEAMEMCHHAIHCAPKAQAQGYSQHR